MTTTQITNILGEGRLNTWVDISEDYNIITFISEKKVFLMDSGVYKQLYFNTSDENMYVRVTDSRTVHDAENFTPPNNRWVMTHQNNKPVYVRLLEGGVESTNSDIGIYHSVWCFDHILGFLSPNQ